MWPGDTADVTTLIPVIDRLRQRFAISRVCVVADRGMISAQTIASLEERGLEYILGVRERSSKEVQEVVLNDPAPSVSLVIPRRGRRDTELEAKEVRVGGRRYIVCRNLAEAKRDAEVREAVLRHLRSALRGGDKTLVGNSAYRRYLKTPDEKHFEIDDNRVIEDARYDGLYVLRTNTTLNALAVMLRYRELLRVEDIFKTTKAILDTRPIYHKTDATIRGHVFCSFLALVVRKALDDRLAAACESACKKDPLFGVIGIQSGPPNRGVHTGFHDSRKPRLGCWSWRRLQKFAGRFLYRARPLRRSAGILVYLGRS